MPNSVSIITVYDTHNCGSYLQAWALSKYLTKEGTDVIFLRSSLKRRVFNFAKQIKQLIKLLLKGDFYRCNIKYASISGFYIAQKKLRIKSRKVNDIVIIGSDTLWNFNSSFFRTNADLYLGKSVNAKRKCTYAVSMANTSLETVNGMNGFKEAVCSFDYLTVRDKSTQSIIENTCGVKPEIVCDPTLLLEPKDYDCFVQKEVSDEYILLYLFGRIPTDLMDNIIKLSKEKGLPIYSIDFSEKRDWCDQILPCDPSSFIAYIKSAKYVITNTFHGTIFSVIFKRHFLVYGNQKTKIVEFLKNIGLSNRICTIPENVKEMIEESIDYASVNLSLSHLRENSYRQLERMTRRSSD